MARTFAGFVSLLAIAGAVPGLKAATYEPCRVSPPRPDREFRGAWVATVANIDWPSAKGLSTAEQKEELLRILDRAVKLKLNAIIFQVRPACDAMYASAIEPWSEYLTGAMGQAPQPYYDPLAFAIEEAHKRGLELHAWFNPYRARLLPAPTPACAQHISKTHPALVRQYGKLLWLDPGEKEVQDYSLGVVLDVVRRYDVDGIHFDDYFYPYKEQDAAGQDLDFPDAASWRRFGAGSRLSREDWRRQNVNTFIQRVYASIKALKPWVKFGVSPFGIWRPGNPAQIHGYDAYEKLYADSRKWLSNGWLDYFAPQLYWSIEAPDQSFPVLLKWWGQQNSKHRLLVAGLDATKTLGKWPPDEIVRQIQIARKQSNVGGHIHWNMKSLMRNGALDEALERQVYLQPAIMPAAPWLDGAHPGKPLLSARPVEGGAAWSFEWKGAAEGRAWLWLLQTRSGGHWTTEVLPEGAASHLWKGPPPDLVALSAVNRVGSVGTAAGLRLR
jgi:uncharacterized lipoprotein YddW (UPF0748 family)